MASMPDVQTGESQRTLSVDELFEQICKHSDIVETAGKIFREAHQLDCTIDDLRAAVQVDPVLAAQIVRRVNSAYYGLSDPVHDLRQAVAVLGFYDLRNLTLVAVVSRFLDQQLAVSSFNRTLLWQHSLGVAAASHLLARIACRGNPAEVFAAGVIHDIGYVLLDLFHRRQFHQVMAKLDRNVSTCELERRILGFDHAELGARLAETWNLPAAVVEAVRYHHEPQNYFGPHRESVYVLNVANYFCSRGGWTSLGVQNIAPPPDCAYAGLQLDTLALSVFWDEFPGVLERSQLLASA